MGTWPDGSGVVEFPDGLRVRGGSRRRRADLDPPPEFICLLLGREPARIPCPHVWVRWPDFRPPASTDDAVAALRLTWERARQERVAVMCGGGVGRTGAAIAILAVLSGVAPEQAVDWTRRHYHRRAVETPGQRRWVATTAAGLTR